MNLKITVIEVRQNTKDIILGDLIILFAVLPFLLLIGVFDTNIGLSVHVQHT